MAFKHLDDPLDYLYEELPEAEMAELRKHLAECPQCREEVAKVREAVKFYRSAACPPPPAGLAKRAAAKALAAAKAPEPAGAEKESGGEGGDAHFENIKAEMRNELRSGRRTRLFHPAWTVAASVILVFAVLYHVSPRRTALSNAEARMSAPLESAAHREETAIHERDWSLLPEPFLREDAALEAVPPPAPVLKEAEIWDEPPPAAPAPIIPETPAPMEGPPKPTPGQARDRDFKGASVRAASPAAEALPGQTLTGDDLDALDALLDADSAKAPNIVDMVSGMEPPRFVARPDGVDTIKLARDLIFMAGMQMGHGELGEAEITIGLLRKYDPEKATELTGILAAMMQEKEERELRAAEAAAIEPVPEAVTAPSAAPADSSETPETGDEPPPNRRFLHPENEGKATTTPMKEPVTSALAVPAVEEAIESSPEPDRKVSRAADSESVQSTVMESMPVGANIASSSVDPVYSQEFPSAIPSAIGEVEPPPFAVSESPIADAPDVPKASPDAIPPTLWERSAGNQPTRRFFLAPSPVEPREPRRRFFTTDPYYRDR